MILIFDSINITSAAYTTKTSAAKSLNLSSFQLNRYMKLKKPYKKQYYFTSCDLVKDKNKVRKNNFK
jgi:hypothetical protein